MINMWVNAVFYDDNQTNKRRIRAYFDICSDCYVISIRLRINYACLPVAVKRGCPPSLLRGA
ncbi:hypothetical protein AYY17_09670 [Morganella psychrotolerans]|uniref:Uncharacterized protein n=1 Tax=Morganella psychrotolerans TaxID=368603 RepID=A0A1B8H402_9GAMM|nr:hypothetical protein AYY17_09670 [Morganella psychrotolerans]